MRVPDRPDPSAWSHRLVAAALAGAGFAIAGYLALVQLGRVDAAWEPLFGDGSRRVLDSSLATALPVPDAAVGAAGYLLEAPLLLVGGRARWSRRPWVVLLGAAVVAAMAAGGIVLTIVQVAVLRAACTLCLASAAVSFAVAVMAAPEAAAAAGSVIVERRRGRPLARALAGADPLPRPRSAAARIHDQQ